MSLQVDKRADQLDDQRPIAERRRYLRPEGSLGMRPVDRNFLRRFTLGNRHLEREVLMLFANQAPVYVDALAMAETPKAWHDAAHTLKGASRAVGAWRLARLAEQAERLVFADQPDKRAFMVDTTREAATEAADFIAELFANG